MRPPGFQDAAVASSATAIKAPPIPSALPPEPTGFIEGGVSKSGTCAVDIAGMSQITIAHKVMGRYNHGENFIL